MTETTDRPLTVHQQRAAFAATWAQQLTDRALTRQLRRAADDPLSIGRTDLRALLREAAGRLDLARAKETTR